MIKRSTRRAVAWTGILSIALAQFALTAHACTLGAAAAIAAWGPAALDVAGDSAPPCGHDAGPAAAANLCGLHCSDAATATPSADLPPVALTALPVSVTPFHAIAATPSDVPARPAAFPGASPPLLQFCRLLI
jgi:hypothetical protein